MAVSPGLYRPVHVAAAFKTLGRHDAVFGPARDGGYWLVGLRRTGRIPPGLLRGVAWSTEQALAESIDSLGGLRVARVDTLADVDTAADLPRGKPARA